MSGWRGDLLLILGALVLGTAIAAAAGAANFGTALGIGELAFVAALMYVLLRR